MIAVVGEALIDAHYDGELLRPFPGAGPFNTAIALAHLGAPVCFVGAISPDRFGRLLEEALRSAGVETGTVVRVDASTPVAIVDLSSAEPAYSFYLADTGLEAFSSQDLPELPAEVGELHVGSLGLASDPPGAAVVELAEREASTNALVVDPNIRPVAIEDRGAYLRRFERLGGIADLVKLSVSDAGLALPGLERRRGGSPPARGRCRLRRAHAWLRRRGGMDRDRLDHGCRTPRDRRRHGRPRRCLRRGPARLALARRRVLPFTPGSRYDRAPDGADVRIGRRGSAVHACLRVGPDGRRHRGPAGPSRDRLPGEGERWRRSSSMT